MWGVEQTGHRGNLAYFRVTYHFQPSVLNRCGVQRLSAVCMNACDVMRMRSAILSVILCTSSVTGSEIEIRDNIKYGSEVIRKRNFKRLANM